jgi:hypothetical protein
VLGGLLVAVVVLVARGQGVTLVTFDTTLQSPLMIAFFTTIGFGASLSLLKVGGPQVLRFFLLATVFAFVQNIVGILLALGFGLHPLFGVLAGSVTLTGGPATGLAFAPLFEAGGRRRRIFRRHRGRDRRHRRGWPRGRPGQHRADRAGPPRETAPWPRRCGRRRVGRGGGRSRLAGLGR